jgi:rhodanese-related sulfurtransferase/DNA-binding transcriptional ArsR family regulator
MQEHPHIDLHPPLYRLYALVGKALSHPSRLMILELLAQGAQTVEGLSQALDQPLANISQHLQVLKHTGLVLDVRQGTHRHYRLSDPSLMTLLHALRTTSQACQAEAERVLRAQDPGLPTLTFAQLEADIQAGRLTVLDLRSAEEYAQGHLPGAILTPHDTFVEQLPQLALPLDRPVTAYCRSAQCSGNIHALHYLAELGYQVLHAGIGYPDWVAQHG